MKKQFVCTLLAVLLAWGGEALAARTTRDLVFEDEAPAAEQVAPAGAETAGKESIGVKTTVVLVRDGQTSTVAPSHEFKSGDKVKLVFTPSVDGYVYWLSKGSSGNFSLLYPSAQAGMDNAVKRNVEYTVPATGAFRFDDRPGNEELLCILSTHRQADLDTAVAGQGASAGQEVAVMEAKHESKRQTRDLVFEEEEAGDVSTKKQEAPQGEPFVAHYILKHN